MSETVQPPIGSGVPRDAQAEWSLVDGLIALAKRKKQLIVIPLVVALLVGGGSLMLPNIYKATTRILPPQQAQSGAAALLAQLGGVAGAAAGAAGVKNPNDLYIGMLKSRTIADGVIKSHDLQKVYGKTSMEATRKLLAKNTTILTGKDSLIVIEVEDADPKLAAAIANSYTAELLALTKVVAITEASQRRLFFERQLQTSKRNLEEAESSLRDTLGSHGVINVDSESRAIVETVARLRAQIAAKEIQFKSMQKFVTPNNQEYIRLQSELSSAKSELASLENGKPSQSQPAEGAKNKGGLENMKTLREVKYHQMLYELLSKQYEVARLDEAKDASIIQVLDPAIPPESKSRPARAIMAITAAIFSFVLLICWVLGKDLLRRMADTDVGRARTTALKQALRFN